MLAIIASFVRFALISLNQHLNQSSHSVDLCCNSSLSGFANFLKSRTVKKGGKILNNLKS